jgi:hypothetical protein
MLGPPPRRQANRRTMVWRKSYNTKIIEGFDLPSLACLDHEGRPVADSELRLALAGWTVASLMEQRIWSRLYEGSFGLAGTSFGLILREFDGKAMEEVQLCLPPSRASMVLAWIDPDGALWDLVQPDQPNRAVAWNPQGRLAMVGPATEDAWETMLEALYKS